MNTYWNLNLIYNPVPPILNTLWPNIFSRWVYIYKYQLIPVAKHVHYVNSGTGIYNYIKTLSHEYFRNRKQETNYHILSVSQGSLRIMHNDILYAHRAFPREYCQFGQTTSSCCYKIIILFSLQHNTFPCKNPRRILFKKWNCVRMTLKT